MISSTARDLPDHRKDVMDACLRQGMFPTMMEHLPAADADAIAESLRMVDEANIYLGVFAHRYGYVPKGDSLRFHGFADSPVAIRRHPSRVATTRVRQR